MGFLFFETLFMNSVKKKALELLETKKARCWKQKANIGSITYAV
jgi:hypothetical protein